MVGGEGASGQPRGEHHPGRSDPGPEGYGVGHGAEDVPRAWSTSDRDPPPCLLHRSGRGSEETPHLLREGEARSTEYLRQVGDGGEYSTRAVLLPSGTPEAGSLRRRAEVSGGMRGVGFLLRSDRHRGGILRLPHGRYSARSSELRIWRREERTPQRQDHASGSQGLVNDRPGLEGGEPAVGEGPAWRSVPHEGVLHP